jgi:hypothetical protein
VTVSTDWAWRGLQTIILENRYLKVTILPELGGKIWSIVSKAHDQEMLWHNPRVIPRPAHHGATYDNWFAGGWDEVFPNDFPVEIDGEAWPDHGEVWSAPAEWHVARGESEASVTLEHRGIVLPTRFRKRVSLVPDGAGIRIDYTIANEGASPISVHWKTHPALPLGDGARLHLPVGRVVDEPAFGAVFAQPEFAWPHAPLVDGTTRDLSVLPEPGRGGADFYYGATLSAGYAAVSWPRRGLAFGLAFDPGVLDAVWVFSSHGGWRGLDTVIIEPCTGYRADLLSAVAQGTARTLASGEILDTTITAAVLGGDAALDRWIAQASRRTR